jgi:Chitobiase/beta-hexosaminidase C-terminal domain
MKKTTLLKFCFLFVVFLCVFAAALQAQVNVTTYHNDNARTGQNSQETILTPSNVNSSQFGKLFTVPLDGWAYAQPLYLSNVNISGGTHNVLYEATEHDSLYAIDADSGTIYWQISLIPSGGTTVNSSTDLGCGDLVPEVGITGTPVIDTSTGTIYVVAKSKVNGSIVQYLHAIDIVTSAEKFNGPVAIQASVPGTASDGNGTTVSFNPLSQNQRPALLLDSGHVVIGWSSHCDTNPWHGWIISYSAGNLTQQPEAAFNSSPNGYQGGIWMGGGGLAADANGNIYFATGNGTWNGTTDYGDSILKLGLPTGGSFPIVDYFTPYNQSALSGGDTDVASGGVVLLPTLPSGQQLLAQMGKEGKIYLIDRNNMGKYCPNQIPPCSGSDPQIVQEIPGATVGVWGSPAYWNGSVYWGPASDGGNPDNLKAFSFNANNSGLLSTSPTSISAKAFSYTGPTPSISSNGNTNGILWGLDDSLFGNCSGISNCQVLYAYDATNLGSMLYNSNQAPKNRDVPGSQVKFATPTIANGKVYVGSEFAVSAFGLLNGMPTAATPTFSPLPGNYTSGQSVTLSDTTSGAVIHCTTDGSTPTAGSQVCTTVQVNTTTTIKAIAVATGFNNSLVATGIYTIGPPPAATPTFSPLPGNYNSAQLVTLSDTTSGAVIHCTTDGSTPTAGSPVCTTVQVNITTTIQAIAVATGFNNSAVAIGTYTITLPTAATPTFSPLPGNYNSGQLVTLSDTTSGAVIHCTTDGSTPTVGSPVCTTVQVNTTTTIRAIAAASGFNNSAIATGTYTIGVVSGVITFIRNSSVGNVAGGAASGSVSIAFPVNTAAGDLIVVPVAVAGGGTPVLSMSDPVNGNYVQAVSVTDSAGNRSSTFYFANSASISSSQNLTLSWSGGASGAVYITLGATEFNGAAATGPLNGTTSNFSNAGSLSLSSGSLTPTVSNCAFVAASNNDNGSSETLTSSGWKATWNVAGSGAGGQADYLISTNANAQQATWTISGRSFAWASQVAAFCPSQTPTVATPTFSPLPGNYSSPQSVTLSDTTSGATIYYTTDGSTPTVSSPVYSLPIQVSTTTTIQAMAAANGFNNSAIAVGVFTIEPTAATPTFSPLPGNYNSGQSVTLSDTTSGAVIHCTTDGSTPTAGSPVCTTVQVNTTTTIQAIAVATGFNNSGIANGVYTITPTAATPTFSPLPGTYNSVQSVILSDTTSGAVIHCTTDGSTPTAGSPVCTTVQVNTSTTIQAIAVATGFNNSAVGSGTYTLTAATPTFSPLPGNYTSGQSVTLSDTTSGAVIHCTTDGSTPTAGSPVCTTVQVNTTTTIQAIAVATGFNNSAVASGTYTITLPTAALPTFSPLPGNYTSGQSVTLSDTTSGAVIHCTTDGSTPTAGSPVCTTVQVNTTATIKAIAVATGFNNSAVAIGTYTIGSGSGGVTFVRNSSVGNVSTGQSSGSLAIAFPANTTAGDLIVVTVTAAGSGATMVVSDPVNGNYSQALNVTNTVGNRSAIFYFANSASISLSQKLTLSWSGGGTGSLFITLGATEFTGASASGALNGVTSNFSNTGSLNLSTGSLTPTVTNCGFVSVSNNNNGSTETLTSTGWKAIWNIAGSGAGGQADYMISPNANSQQTTWTIPNRPFPWAAGIAAFCSQ